MTTLESLTQSFPLTDPKVSAHAQACLFIMPEGSCSYQPPYLHFVVSSLRCSHFFVKIADAGKPSLTCCVRHITLHHTTPHLTTSRHITPHHITEHHCTSHYITLCTVKYMPSFTSHYITLLCISVHYIMSCYITIHHIECH